MIASTSSAAIFYKLNPTLPSGVYTVRAYNAFVPVTTATFQYVAPLSDPFVVSAQFTQNTYIPGEIARAILTVQQANGLSLPQTASVSFNASFGNTTQANTSVTLTSSGTALIQVNIPATATQNPVVIFTVIAANRTYVYQQTLSLVLATQPVIEFFPATGYLTANIPNRIYFQAWTDSSKTQAFEITGASLRQVQSKTSIVLLLNQSISTGGNGKGSFDYTPTAIAGAQNPTFEFTFYG